MFYEDFIETIPPNCINCFNRRGNQCLSLNEFMENCFAGPVDKIQKLAQLNTIKEYCLSHGNGQVNSLMKEIRACEKRGTTTRPGEIEGFMAEEARRGNHKGGGEKQKNKNKKKGTKKIIWGWDEL